MKYAALIILSLAGTSLFAQPEHHWDSNSRKHQWEIGLPDLSVNYQRYWKHGLTSRVSAGTGFRPYFTSEKGFGAFFNPYLAVETRFYPFHKQEHKGVFVYHRASYKLPAFGFNPERINSPMHNLSTLGLGYRSNLGKRFYLETQLGYGLYLDQKMKLQPGFDMRINLGIRF